MRYWCPRKLLYVCEIGKHTQIMTKIRNGIMARRRRFRILRIDIIPASSPKPMGCKVLWWGRTCIFLVGVSWLILRVGEMDRACSPSLSSAPTHPPTPHPPPTTHSPPPPPPSNACVRPRVLAGSVERRSSAERAVSELALTLRSSR